MNQSKRGLATMLHGTSVLSQWLCRSINSAHRVHRSAMPRQTVLFLGSREPFAISSHSAANRRNRSDASIGRPPCVAQACDEANSIAPERFRSNLNKFYAPPLWTTAQSPRNTFGSVMLATISGTTVHRSRLPRSTLHSFPTPRGSRSDRVSLRRRGRGFSTRQFGR